MVLGGSGKLAAGPAPSGRLLPEAGLVRKVEKDRTVALYDRLYGIPVVLTNFI